MYLGGPASALAVGGHLAAWGTPGSVGHTSQGMDLHADTDWDTVPLWGCRVQTDEAGGCFPGNSVVTGSETLLKTICFSPGTRPALWLWCGSVTARIPALTSPEAHILGGLFVSVEH